MWWWGMAGAWRQLYIEGGKHLNKSYFLLYSLPKNNQLNQYYASYDHTYHADITHSSLETQGCEGASSGVDTEDRGIDMHTCV